MESNTSGFRADANVCKLPGSFPEAAGRKLLCKEKNNALVEITLPENSNISAAEYALYLPDKKLLQKKLKEWIEEETEVVMI